MSGIVEKLLDKGKEAGNEDFFIDSPSHGIVNTTLLERVCKYMDTAGIPYIRYGMKNRSKDLILFEKKNMDLVKNIEKGTRIRMGLQIESETDLHIALFEQNKINSLNERIVSFDELTEYEAKRIEQLMAKEGYACAYKQIRQNSFRVSAHEKRKRKLLDLLLIAMLEEIYEIPTIIDSRLKIYRESEKIADLLTTLKKGELEETHRIYSLSDPNKCIEVSRNGLRLSDMVGDRLVVPIKEKDIDEIAKILLTELEYPVCETVESINLTYGSKEQFLSSYPSIEVLDISNKEVLENKEYLLYKTEMKKGEMTFSQSYEPDKVIKEVNDFISEKYEIIGYKEESPQVPFDFITGKAVGYDMELVLNIVKDKYISNSEAILESLKDNRALAANNEKVIKKGEEDEI